VEHAFSILDRLENKSQFRINRPPRRPGENVVKRFKVPRYDMVIYTSMIRGFIISRKLGAAVHLVERLDRTYGYSEGEDQHLDAALADLIDLKELGDQWVSLSPSCFRFSVFVTDAFENLGSSIVQSQWQPSRGLNPCNRNTRKSCQFAAISSAHPTASPRSNNSVLIW
jgi:hypothetical protein